MANPSEIPQGERLPNIYPIKFWIEEEAKTVKVKISKKFKVITKDDLGNDVERDESREVLVDEVQYENVEYVEWMKKGDPKTSQVIKVSQIKRIDPPAWSVLKKYHEAWKKQEEVPLNGTALSNWPLIKSKRVTDQLAMLSILTVEDLAEMPDSYLPNIGMGSRDLRDRAKAFVKMKTGDAEKAVLFAEQNKKLDEQATQIADLQKSLDQLTRNLPQREMPQDVSKKNKGA